MLGIKGLKAGNQRFRLREASILNSIDPVPILGDDFVHGDAYGDVA